MRPETGFAREECPNPGLWNAPDGIASEVAVSDFMGSLIHLLKPLLVVETGSYLGHSAWSIGTALKAEGRGRLVSIEINLGHAQIARDRCVNLPVEVLLMSSLSYESTEKIGLVFLDSEYDTRLLECYHFKSQALKSCVIVSHDTVVDTYREGLNKLADDGVVFPWIYLPVPRGLGITRYNGSI